MELPLSSFRLFGEYKQMDYGLVLSMKSRGVLLRLVT